MSEELISIITERIYELRVDSPDYTEEDLKEEITDEVLDIIDHVFNIVSSGAEEELGYF